MSASPSLLVLVTDSGRDALPYRVDDSGYDRIDVINLTDGVVSAGSAVTDTDADVTIHRVDEVFGRKARRLRDQYVDSVEAIPEGDGSGGLLRPLYAGVSPWVIFVDRYKSKSAEYDHPFNRIARVNAAAAVVSERDPDEVVLLTTDPRERELYTETIDGVTVSGDVDDRRVPSGLLVALTGILVGLLRIGVAVAKTVIARVIEWRGQRTDGDGEYDALIFSRTNQWEQYDWGKDRYYHGFPDVLDREYGLSYRFALHLTGTNPLTVGEKHREADGGVSRSMLTHARLGLRDHLSMLRSYLGAVARLVAFQYRAGGVRRIGRVDAGPLLERQLWQALSDIPHALAQYRGLRSELRSERPRVVVTTHFESRIGRMTVAAARAEGVPVVALQHGPIAPGKLQYHIRANRDRYPMPDRVAIDGEYAADVLTTGGFPDDPLETIGGVRYGELFRAIQEQDADGSTTEEKENKPIVVFFGLSDYRGMAATVIPVVSDLDRPVLLKPHPSAHEATVSYITEQLSGDNPHVEIVEADAHALIRRAELAVASYSSTAIETLAFGKPLVCVTPRYRLDPTPFPEERVPKIRTTEELRRALESPRDQSAELEGFLDRFFGPRDGDAASRLASLCREIADTSTPPEQST